MNKIVIKESAGRIDKYLANHLDISRVEIIKNIKSGDILVNNQKVKPSYQLSDGDIVKLDIKDQKPIMSAKAQDIKLDIAYEDDYLIIINKPSGIVVHPAAGHNQDTLVNGLVNYATDLSDLGGEFRPGIIHRLDKDTSGLLMVAKNNQIHQIMQNALQKRLIKRSYIALVHGVIEENSGTIKAPIGRDAKVRIKQAVTPGGKEATTHFRVIKRLADKTLIKCDLETGRTHQIRVHLSYIGYPIVGDPLYSSLKVNTGNGQLLHAYRLSFPHPITNQEIIVNAPLPLFFESFLQQEGVDHFEF